MKNIRIALFTILLCVPVALAAQLKPHNYVPKDAEKTLYKSTPTGDLYLWTLQPETPVVEGKNPAILFFFGGGWQNGSISQFYRQAKYLASRGMTAILVEYRTESSAGTTPIESVMDAKSAMRFVRTNAAGLGVDPDRIVASGGSAGGHLAAATAYVTAFDDPADDLSVSPRPQALVLFNPVVDNSEKGYGYERVGERWAEFSPMHNITAQNAVPTLFMLGSRDNLIPVSTAEEYARVCRQAGGRCDVKIYEGGKHGFFNVDYYSPTLDQMDAFLVDLGYLPSK